MDISKLLGKVLEERKKTNPRYSLRALARSVDMEPSQISKIIRGKINASLSTKKKIINNLKYDPLVKENILNYEINLADQQRKKYDLLKNNFKQNSEDEVEPFENHLDILVFTTMGLPLTEKTPAMIAQILNRDLVEINHSIARLIQKKVIKFENNILEKVQLQFTDPIADQLVSERKKEIQKCFLELSIHALKNVPIEQRLNGTLTFTIDPELIEKAKLKIDCFLKELNAWASSKSANEKSIYNFTFGLYPIAQLNQNESVLKE